jgi:hypothetical protein
MNVALITLGWVFLPSIMLARLLFRPRYVHGPEDPRVALANRLRAATGAAVGIGVWVAYSKLPATEALAQTLLGYLCGLALALPPYLLFVAILVVATRRHREALRRMLAGPLLSIALTLVVVAVLLGAVYGKLHYRLSLFMPPGLASFVILQVILLTLATSYWVWMHGFRAVDGNPLLRPLVTPLFAWAGAVVNQFVDLFEQPGTVPDWVTRTTSFGGAVLVTGFAVWEYRRVSRVMRITLRSGPPPLAPPVPRPPRQPHPPRPPDPQRPPWPPPYPPQMPPPYPPPYPYRPPYPLPAPVPARTAVPARALIVRRPGAGLIANSQAAA